MNKKYLNKAKQHSAQQDPAFAQCPIPAAVGKIVLPVNTQDHEKP